MGYDPKTNTLTIDDEENDDWIRTLPGYRESEAKIHDELAKKHAAENGEPPTEKKMRKGRFVFKGGAGSGNFGHKGLKGHQGGSLPAGKGGSAESAPEEGSSKTPKSDAADKAAKRRAEDEARGAQDEMAEAARSRDAVGFTEAERKTKAFQQVVDDTGLEGLNMGNQKVNALGILESYAKMPAKGGQGPTHSRVVAALKSAGYKKVGRDGNDTIYENMDKKTSYAWVGSTNTAHGGISIMFLTYPKNWR